MSNMASNMFGFHGCIHVIMIAVIAFLVKRCVEIQHFGASSATTFMEPPCDLQNVPHTPAPEDESMLHLHNVNNKPMNNEAEGDDITMWSAADKPSSANDDSQLSSMELLSKASTFFVDTTVGTLMQMTQAHIFDGADSDEDLTQNAETKSIVDEGSSVWCWGSKHTQRICRFHNLCYFPEEDDFVFFHSVNSIISGVPIDRFSPTLLDMSSVHDHNMQYFNYVDLPSSEAVNFNVEFINTLSLIYRRFNPDNLMHVFHDDLLPMFSTLQMMSGNSTRTNASAFDIQLVFMEGWSPGDHIDLYEAFSTYKPLFKSDLQARNIITCFRDTYVGITKATTWYQYGFREPQGPIPGHTVTAHEVRQFTRYLKQRLNTDTLQVPKGDKYVVLFSRKHNRMIVNEVELTLALVRELKMKVLAVGVETHSVADMIAILSKAAILIGAHGSLLSLTMFLPPGAILIEIFPYAVNPNNYTPYRLLASLPGMAILYKSWRNVEVKNTITHPDRPWDTGGIIHLSQAEQDHILHSTQVPKHLCCRDPEWLFRIYQDTIVDISSLLSLVHNALEIRDSDAYQSVLHSTDLSQRQVYPAQVHNIRCEGDTDNDQNINLKSLTPPSLWLAWEPPWNVKYIEVSSIKYEVWIQEQGLENYTAWILSRTSYQFTAGLKPHTTYNIWVRAIINEHIQGPFNQEHISCST